MNPQPGDIWQYIQPGRADSGLTVLLHERMGSHPSHFSVSYYGLDLLTGEYDEFIFSVPNMPYWRKLA